MKVVTLTALLLLVMVSAISQDAATGSNSSRLQKAKPRQQWLMRYEIIDTTDRMTGRKFTVSRAYYFNKVRRQLQTIQVREINKRHGLSIIYSFYDNQLTKVMITPPRSECRRCGKQFYFSEIKTHSSNDTHDLQGKADAYIKEAAFLKSKMPDRLQPGYFEWESSEKEKGNHDYLIVNANGQANR